MPSLADYMKNASPAVRARNGLAEPEPAPIGALRPSVQVLIVEGLGPSVNAAFGGSVRSRASDKKAWRE